MKEIFLGFEIGTGEKVFVRPSHLIVTGMTQLSGKTSTLQALIKRGNFKAVIFKTKIGEKGITEGSLIPPYYKDDFDWEYALDLLEASRKEKLKFEKGWIIRYSKNATSLLGFKKNIDTALTEKEWQGKKLRDIDINILSVLQAYLDKILPELQYAPLSNILDLREGINIMDLERFREETQGLIIRSVLREVLKKHKNTILVIPECWKSIPEGRGSPVKRDAESFIRQGATNNNYLFLDSQDITGVSKTILKQVSTWIMGYQREVNEIKRTLDQLPIPKKDKPETNDIATLKVGHFYVATSDFTKKIYVQPTWLDSKTAKKVALGKIDVNTLEPPEILAPYSIVKPEIRPVVGVDEKFQQSIKKDINELRNDFFNKIQQQQEAISKVYSELFTLKTSQPTIDDDTIVAKVLQKVKIPQSGTVNTESIIQQVLQKMPKQIGTQVFEVAPLEKIQKNFLQEAKDKIMNDINTLSDYDKKALKYIESAGGGRGIANSEIITKCFHLKAGGSSSTKVSIILSRLRGIEVVEKTSGGRSSPRLKQRIKELLEVHNATEQEIQQVYDHILNEMISKN